MSCTEYRPDHNGECQNCDEPLDAHALWFVNENLNLRDQAMHDGELIDQLTERVAELEIALSRAKLDIYGFEQLYTKMAYKWKRAVVITALLTLLFLVQVFLQVVM